MAGNIELKVLDRDLSRALKGMRLWGGKTLRALGDDVKAATLNTAADAKANVKGNDSIATGQLINSIENEYRAGKQEGTVTVGANYGGYLEFGRKAGGMPPVKFIFEWVRKKGVGAIFSVSTRRQVQKKSTEQKQMGIAWAIAKSIMRNGTKPRPFLIPAWRENATRLVAQLRRTLEQSGKYGSKK